MGALGRGTNIVFSSGPRQRDATIGSLYFLTRPHPSPDDLSFLVSLGAKATIDFDQRDFSAIDRLVDFSQELRQARGRLYQQVGHLLRHPLYARTLGKELFTPFSLSRDLGMKRMAFTPKGAVFGYVHANSIDELSMSDAIARWIDGPLSHFIEKFGVGIVGLERMRELVKGNRLLKLKTANVQLFPWGAAASTGPSVYEVTAGEIGCLLAGHEIFPGLGPVLRIVDAPDTNSAELMTRPISVGGGKFSLVCRITLATLPGSHQPMVFFRFTRRRWATELVDKPFRGKRVGGYAFSARKHPSLAFRFDMDFKKAGWTTDPAYDELELALGLATGYSDARVLDYPALDDTCALVMQMAGLAESKKSAIKAGVPVADQLAAFECIVQRLQSKGFAPLANFTEVVRKAPSVPRISVIRSPLVLSQLLSKTVGEEDEDDGEGAYTPSLQHIEQSVVELTKRSLSEWFGKKTPILDRRYGNLAGLVSDMVRRSGIATDDERRTLYVLVGSTDEIPWIQTVVRMMLGDAVDVRVAELPLGVHGHRSQLPCDDPSPKIRMEARKQAWIDFATKNRFASHPMFLIQADDWYEVNGRRLPDDTVNKAAARRTLASELGATVQYLLPARAQKLDNYLMRLQAAILDLLYGHAGCMLGLEEATATAFPQSNVRPRQTVAIGSVNVAMGAKSGTVVAAIRVDSDSGRPQIRLAHQEAEPIFTSWMRFEDALAYVARRSILRIPDSKQAPGFFQRFLAEVLDEAAARDPHSAIFIESTRSAKLWKRLADKTGAFGPQILDAELEPRPQWKQMRIFRVRDQAPTMVNLRKYGLALDNGNTLQVATSVQRLFSVAGATAPTYWSYAPLMGQPKRGASCYRPMMLPDTKNGAKTFAPDYGQHQTPRGTEFVVLQAQPDDDIDRLARYCELLRVGVPQARKFSS